MATPRNTEGGVGGNGGRKPPTRQPIHKAVLDGDDCKVIDLTKWCCFTLHHVVEVRVSAGLAWLTNSPTVRTSRCYRSVVDRCRVPHTSDCLTCSLFSRGA